MSTIHERIKRLRENSGLSMEALAALLSLKSWQTIQQWENGKTAPKRSRVDDVARVLNTTSEYILFGDAQAQTGNEVKETPAANESEFTNIRRFDLRASAGEGRLVFDYDALEPFKIRSDFLKKNGASEKNTFFMTAKGDSMEPIIPDGADVLVVENGHEIINGKVYVFFLNKNIYIKSLSKTEGGIVALSYNHAYDPMFIGPKDSFKIIGRVIMCSFVL
ncbi:helix-turn-helix transcriptional regulator [Advenella sp. WQ 585]|uniref:Helix-turn-helix transcriptional regulator n=1 Tax=Advenella mandrilli TaxID=2800330 RepID=A0ABS1E9T0_9BURK|nr:XRE family transcriptional regulator [Advenella mandrilli]MBK1780587.1 helix-turn-helix transcriptional regulator [Advenella mandrilli]